MKLLVASSLLAAGISAAQLAQAQASKRRLGGANNIADEFEASPGHSTQDHGTASSESKQHFDVGLLNGEGEAPGVRRLDTSCTPGDTVTCVDGNVNGSDPSVPCSEACGGQCCSGAGIADDACSDFTGEVCKDGISCMGESACKGAKISSIIRGCNGTNSCLYAAADGGYIGEVNNACHGDFSCDRAAAYEGRINAIKYSCLEEGACEKAAAGYYKEPFGGGKITGIYDGSCIGYRSCYKTAYYEGRIGSITSSCVGEKSCSYAAAYPDDDYGDTAKAGQISDMRESCIGASSCYSLAYYGGIVGNVTSACNGTGSCNYTGANYGYVQELTRSCNAETACAFAGSGSIGAIRMGLVECCNLVNECKDANQDTLPSECILQKPSQTPSTSVAPSTSIWPSLSPSFSAAPSSSGAPSEVPPTTNPTKNPTRTPSVAPTGSPTSSPSKRPSKSPSGKPTASPTRGIDPGGTPPTQAPSKSAKRSKKSGSGTKSSKPVAISTIKRIREHSDVEEYTGQERD